MTTAALAISVRWGDRLIDATLLRRGTGAAFSLGSGAGADVPVPRAGKAVFRFEGEVPRVDFTDGVRGEVLRNGETPLAMSDVIHRGLAVEAREGWSLPLGRRDGVLLEFGELAVEAWPVKAPTMVSRLREAWDYQWLNVLLVTLMLGLLLVLRFELTSMEGEAFQEDGLSTAAVTMRRVLVTAHKPEPRSAPVEAPDQKPGQQPASAGAPKPKPMPVTHGTGGVPVPTSAVKNLFSGLGGQGVLGNGGLSNELTRAMGHVVGAGNGLGGLTLRGNGGGGDVGGPERIGSIGRTPLGPGGAHDVKLVKDGSAAPPSNESPPVITCAAVGCLDKELIRKVVRDHLAQVRFCYESLLSRHPSLEGRVVVKWHVTGAGAVDSSEVVSTPHPELGQCLAGRVRTWRFPAAKQAEAGFTVSYPFVFKQSGS
ncbi:MAG: TonB family protein [Myxococcaceae bacterium]|jgi:TonB family protein|nr:TonB family protein [Myxococcaceae bacterium]